MPRISGIDIPGKKRIIIALTYIYGVGLTTSRQILKVAKIDENIRADNLSEADITKIREVIEKRIFSQVEDLLPVISFGSKKDGETEKKHGQFVERMVTRGYTERQVRRLVEWYMRVKQAG